MAKRKKKRLLSEGEVRRQERMKKIERMMLRGIKNQTHIAAAFGVSTVMIHKDMVEIRKEWAGRDPDDREARITERVTQLDSLLQMSLNEFERSKVDEKEVLVTRKVCAVCNGNEKVFDRMKNRWKVCGACDGEGTQQEVKTRIKETPGDPSFLKIAKDCIVEASKIRGLYPDVKIGMMQRTVVNEGIEGRIKEHVSALYMTAPADDVVMAMAALDGLREKIEKQKKLQNSSVIQTSATPVQRYDDGTANTPETPT